MGIFIGNGVVQRLRKVAMVLGLGFLLANCFVEGNPRLLRAGLDCSNDYVVLFQGPTNPLPSGIPTYTVNLQNACPTGCNVSGIHLSCGWFSSARTINPKIFRRIAYDDCLVNNGDQLSAGQSISFSYANSFSYLLAVSSLSCSSSSSS